jgi:MarR family transcriptional regulator, lower aerobic nicotinate degradation pathway regulator
MSSSLVVRRPDGAAVSSSESLEPLWESVRELYSVLRGVAQTALARNGLLLSEYQALCRCADGPVPLKSITRALGVTPAATTDLVRRLERRRLVRVRPDDRDRRSRLAVLTAAGRRLLSESRAAKRRALASLDVQISPSARRALLDGSAELRRALVDLGDV